MSEPQRLLLVGATGLVGRSVMEEMVGVSRPRLVALARREAPLPRGARMEMMVADPAGWREAIATIAPDAVICALGTTWKKAGEDEAAFRAVDRDLVLEVARAAKEAGAQRFISVSSAGADPHAKPFYLRVKGETDAALGKLGFRRLDILRPGLLKGERGGERRALERIGIVLSPLADLFLLGSKRQYRSIEAQAVARAVLRCVQEKAQGRFVHDNQAIRRLGSRLERPE